MRYPEDILEKAAAMFTAFERPDFDEVCAALMAEREACAKIVDCGCDNLGCDLDEAAARIRSPR